MARETVFTLFAFTISVCDVSVTLGGSTVYTSADDTDNKDWGISGGTRYCHKRNDADGGVSVSGAFTA
jgi:hypothetical protein